MATPGAIRIGTSGWVYKHWKNVFYPADVPQRLWLKYYSGQFDTAEINSSFYRLPEQETVKKWVQQAGKEFHFCPKLSRYVTHAKKLNDPGVGLPGFFDVFDSISPRLGPILIQLPPMLGFKEDKVELFFNYLRTHYKKYKFSLEARNVGWLTKPAITLLEKYNIGWVIAESGQRFVSAETVTASHIYLRFHGQDGSYATSYSSKELTAYAKKCRRWMETGHTLWVFFNNDIHGYAVENAKTLKEMLT